MKINYTVLIVSSLCAFLIGCTTQSNSSPTNVSSVPKDVSTPMFRAVPSTRDRATKICEDIWNKIQDPMSRHDYAEARKIALCPLKGVNSDVEQMVFAFRIGLVNSIINPAELDWMYDDLSVKVADCCNRGDFRAAYAALDCAERRLQDIQYPEIDKLFGDMRNELNKLFYSNAAAESYLTQFRNRISLLLDSRIGKPVKRRDIGDCINRLEETLKAEMPEDQKKDVDKLIEDMKRDLENRNMTSFAFKSKGSECFNLLRQRIAELRASIANESGKRASITIKSVIESGKIDFENEIAIMEDAARHKACGRGVLFADSAHSLRAIVVDKKSQANFQDILSAATLMRNRRLIEFALGCGAGVNVAATHDGTLPALLAVETGDVEFIAWICEKGARTGMVTVSDSAMDIAIYRDRLALFKFLESIGCKVDVKRQFGTCCEKGANNIFDYLLSKGAEPSNDDFKKAIEADNLIMVKCFVEKWNFDVNGVGVSAASKNSHGVREYLIQRGMQ